MAADPRLANPPIGTYADERHPIPSAEGTAHPFWIICTISVHGVVTFKAGVWFSRAAAERQLRVRRHHYGPKAVVYCASGYDSDDYIHLCETGRLPDGR